MSKHVCQEEVTEILVSIQIQVHEKECVTKALKKCTKIQSIDINTDGDEVVQDPAQSTSSHRTRNYVVDVFLPYPDHLHPTIPGSAGALPHAVSAVGEVVLVSSTAAEHKHVAPPGVGVEGEPPPGSITGSSVHWTQAPLWSSAIVCWRVGGVQLHQRFTHCHFPCSYSWLQKLGSWRRLGVDLWC